MNRYYERAAHAWTADSVRLIATPSPFAKNSLYYVQEVGYFRALPGYFTERGQLGSYLIVYTVSGKGRLTYGGKTFTLLPNQLFFIDCMDYQYYATDPKELWEPLWVHVNGSSTRAYYEQYAAESGPVTDVPAGSAIPSLLRQLIETHRTVSYPTELIGAKLLVELLTELLLAVRAQRLPAAGMPAYIREVLDQMERHYDKKTTLDEYARRCSVSKYHLAKEFKKHIGLTPNEFLINIRISHAKERLKYAEHPVAEIAGMVGIENVSHFIGLFKARVGCTPLAYRRRWNRPDAER